MEVSDHEAQPLAIRLLGPFDVRVHGAPLPRLRSRKGPWLLALLALRNGREVERVWLAGTLWPDSNEQDAFVNLRQSLSDLRRALGPEAGRLHSPTPHTLSLDVRGADVDLLAFDEAIARGGPRALKEAISVYAGSLLEGCTEEWVLQERNVREQAYLKALDQCAAYALARGDLAAAEEYLRRAVAAEPLRETAQRALMQVLAAGGSCAAALEVYRNLRLRLHREVNAQPDGQTTALYHRIRAEARAKAGTAVGRDAHRLEASADEAGADLPGTNPCGNALPHSLTALLRNLPAPLTSFIGRVAEMAQVKELLEQTRLLTLTGAGGCGKTRLALEVAARLTEEYADGVWLVELAALADPGLVPQTVASALRLRATPDQSLLDRLTDYLKPRELLLVLDNCEHLIEACAYLVDKLLRACPSLRLLVTSREALNIPGETPWRVPPLSLPDRQRMPGRNAPRLSAPSMESRSSVNAREGQRRDSPATERLMEYEAVRLFVERTRTLAPAFRLTRENAPAVIQICRQLDGMPLAIELAAARIKALTVQQIAALLDDRFQLLTSGSRTALPRHQTLHALIDWSYQLLTEEERTVLRRLSVFAGGFTFEAAEAVYGKVLNLLASLVEKSLVCFEEREGEARYRLLETVRQYAHDRLLESGETAAVRRRHLDFFLRLAEGAEPHLTGPEQGAWFERLEREHDNLRAALEWDHEPSNADTQRSEVTDGGGVELALRLAKAIALFWRTRGYLEEGRMWMARALHAAGNEFPGLRAALLVRAAALAWMQSDYAAMRSYSQQSLDMCQAIGDQQGIAAALAVLGHHAECEGDYASARALHEQSLALRQAIGSREEIAGSLGNLGVVALRQGNLPAARWHFEAALAIGRELGLLVRLADWLFSLGHVARIEGNYEAARTHFGESLALSRRLGAPVYLGYAACDLGMLLISQREFAAARATLEEGLCILQEIGNRTGVVRCLEGMAQLAWAQGVPDCAARLFGAAEALRVALQFPVPPVDRVLYDCLPAIAAILGEEMFAAARAEGQAMPLEAAIAYALAEPSPGEAAQETDDA